LVLRKDVHLLYQCFTITFKNEKIDEGLNIEREGLNRLQQKSKNVQAETERAALEKYHVERDGIMQELQRLAKLKDDTLINKEWQLHLNTMENVTIKMAALRPEDSRLKDFIGKPLLEMDKNSLKKPFEEPATFQNIVSTTDVEKYFDYGNEELIRLKTKITNEKKLANELYEQYAREHSNRLTRSSLFQKYLDELKKLERDQKEFDLIQFDLENADNVKKLTIDNLKACDALKINVPKLPDMSEITRSEDVLTLFTDYNKKLEKLMKTGVEKEFTISDQLRKIGLEVNNFSLNYKNLQDMISKTSVYFQDKQKELQILDQNAYHCMIKAFQFYEFIIQRYKYNSIHKNEVLDKFIDERGNVIKDRMLQQSDWVYADAMQVTLHLLTLCRFLAVDKNKQTVLEKFEEFHELQENIGCLEFMRQENVIKPVVQLKQENKHRIDSLQEISNDLSKKKSEYENIASQKNMQSNIVGFEGQRNDPEFMLNVMEKVRLDAKNIEEKNRASPFAGMQKDIFPSQKGLIYPSLSTYELPGVKYISSGSENVSSGKNVTSLENLLKFEKPIESDYPFIFYPDKSNLDVKSIWHKPEVPGRMGKPWPDQSLASSLKGSIPYGFDSSLLARSSKPSNKQELEEIKENFSFGKISIPEIFEEPQAIGENLDNLKKNEDLITSDLKSIYNIELEILNSGTNIQEMLKFPGLDDNAVGFNFEKNHDFKIVLSLRDMVILSLITRLTSSAYSNDYNDIQWNWFSYMLQQFRIIGFEFNWYFYVDTLNNRIEIENHHMLNKETMIKTSIKHLQIMKNCINRRFATPMSLVLYWLYNTLIDIMFFLGEIHEQGVHFSTSQYEDEYNSRMASATPAPFQSELGLSGFEAFLPKDRPFSFKGKNTLWLPNYDAQTWNSRPDENQFIFKINHISNELHRKQALDFKDMILVYMQLVHMQNLYYVLYHNKISTRIQLLSQDLDYHLRSGDLTGVSYMERFFFFKKMFFHLFYVLFIKTDPYAIHTFKLPSHEQSYPPKAKPTSLFSLQNLHSMLYDNSPNKFYAINPYNSIAWQFAPYLPHLNSYDTLNFGVGFLVNTFHIPLTNPDLRLTNSNLKIREVSTLPIDFKPQQSLINFRCFYHDKLATANNDRHFHWVMSLQRAIWVLSKTTVFWTPFELWDEIEYIFEDSRVMAKNLSNVFVPYEEKSMLFNWNLASYLGRTFPNFLNYQVKEVVEQQLKSPLIISSIKKKE